METTEQLALRSWLLGIAAGTGYHDYDFSLSAHDSTYSGLLHWIGLGQVKDATPISVNFHCLRACTHWNFFCFVFDNLRHVLHLFFCHAVVEEDISRAEIIGTNRP
jgi:hypothetical protein